MFFQCIMFSNLVPCWKCVFKLLEAVGEPKKWDCSSLRNWCTIARNKPQNIYRYSQNSPWKKPFNVSGIYLAGLYGFSSLRIEITKNEFGNIILPYFYVSAAPRCFSTKIFCEMCFLEIHFISYFIVIFSSKWSVWLIGKIKSLENLGIVFKFCF